MAEFSSDDAFGQFVERTINAPIWRVGRRRKSVVDLLPAKAMLRVLDRAEESVAADLDAEAVRREAPKRDPAQHSQVPRHRGKEPLWYSTAPEEWDTLPDSDLLHFLFLCHSKRDKDEGRGLLDYSFPTRAVRILQERARQREGGEN